MKVLYIKPIIKKIKMETGNMLEASIEIDHQEKIDNPNDVLSKGNKMF